MAVARVIVAALCILTTLLTHQAGAAPLRIFVGDFTVSGGSNREEVASIIPTLLASRLSGNGLIAVDRPADADALVTGAYVMFGKVFSLDAIVRDSGGKVLLRSFEQGEGNDDLIPAVGRMAAKLNADIPKSLQRTAAPAAPLPTVANPVPPPAPAIPPQALAPAAPAPAVTATPDIIRAQPITQSPDQRSGLQRLPGELNGIAPGKSLEGGARELFVTDRRGIRLYRQGETLQLLDQVELERGSLVLGVDTADLDHDGSIEAYVTVFYNEAPASQVWTSSNGKLRKIADRLPFYLRMVADGSTEQRIYGQEMGRDDDFFGDVREVVKKGDRFELGAALKLPRFGFLYNFSYFTDPKGKRMTAVINEDGRLIVYDGMEEIWRSGDRYGGTENYFKREDLGNMRVTGSQYRWIFLEQRMFVSRSGEVIVPHNTGLFVVGNQRAYEKFVVHALAWNGTGLEEKWRTRDYQGYLADYFFDEARRELVFLEVVKRDGLLAQGSSTISARRVE